MNYFTGSYIVTVVGIILAYFWGEHMHPGSGWMSVFIVFILSVLEVSLSFDNAVVNAMKLEKMTPKWQHRFLTWGIAIAVFGMRFLFPILVVAIFAQLGLLQVAKIALTDAQTYAHYLHESYPPIVSFGGTFLLMLFLTYFFDEEKDVHWIKFLEEKLQTAGSIKGVEVLIALSSLCVAQSFVPEEFKLNVVIAGISGVIIYLLINGLTALLDSPKISKNIAGAGFASFMYLELIDASFSLDGVLGAFALSKDILIITIGLSIGAMFVRSLTIMLVEKKTLAKYVYIEHGAHWAIGVLAAIMIISTFHQIPEVFTGLIGLAFIVASFISSKMYNRINNG